MNSLLAQLTSVSSDSVRDGLLILGGLLGLAALVKQLFVRKPPIEAEFATKRDLKETDEKIDALRVDMNERFGEMDVKRERTLAELHEKVNGVAQDVAFIRGKLEGDT